MTDILVDAAIEECRDRMVRAVEHTKSEFGSIRTGRAAPALVEKLKVDYYGAEVPLQQIAGLHVPEARTLVIAPYEKGSRPSKRPSSPLTSALPRATTGP